jgi:hypothetical protein
VEFQGEIKVILAEKYSFILQQSFHVLKSQNCYKRIDFEVLIKMWATKSWNLEIQGETKVLLALKIFFCPSAKVSCAMIPKLLERN